MSRFIILTILIFTLALPLSAQKYNFRNFSVNDGLTQSEIYSICEDKRGSLWFGSLGGGIIRFDGYTFKSYREEDGLLNNFVYSILEDSKGNLWIGTKGGVCVFNGKTFDYPDGINGPGNNAIRSIIEDYMGNVWIGTENDGLFKYRNKRFESFTTHSGLSGNTINCLLKNFTHWGCNNINEAL